MKLKSPILMSPGSTRRFVVFASETRGPCLEELPSTFAGAGWGEAGVGGVGLFSLSFYCSCRPSHPFDLTIKSSPVFMSDVYEGGLGNGWLKKTFEKMCLSKLSPLITPQFHWDRKKKVGEQEHYW